MIRTSLVLALFAACGDANPDTTAACAVNPHASFLRGNTPVVAPFAVSEGGTVQLKLDCTLPDLPGNAAFDLESVATASTDAVKVGKSGAGVSVTGVHAGASAIRITTPDAATTYGTLDVTVAPFDHVAFRGLYDEIPTTVGVAFAKEATTYAEVLLAGADGTVLADDTFTLSLPAGVSLDGNRVGAFDYGGAPLGDASLGITAAGTTITTPFIVTDHADAIALSDPTQTIPVFGSKHLCFAATLAGRFVTGLNWTFTGEGAQTSQSNCITGLASSDVDQDHAVTIVASAGTATATIDVPVQ